MALSSDLPPGRKGSFDIELSVEVSDREPALSASSSVCLSDSCVEDPILSALFSGADFGREAAKPISFSFIIGGTDVIDGGVLFPPFSSLLARRSCTFWEGRGDEDEDNEDEDEETMASPVPLAALPEALLV